MGELFKLSKSCFFTTLTNRRTSPNWCVQVGTERCCKGAVEEFALWSVRKVAPPFELASSSMASQNLQIFGVLLGKESASVYSGRLMVDIEHVMIWR